jgi:hypothetical protein
VTTDHDEFPSGLRIELLTSVRAISAPRYSTFGVWPYSIPPG